MVLMIQLNHQQILFILRKENESILYDLCCSWVFINIIFNYDEFSMKIKEELRAYHRAYYYRNQEHWKTWAKNYYHQHKEQVKEYRLKNKEKIREYDRKYSLEHKAQKKAYRLRNLEKSRKWQKEYYQKNKQILKIRRYHQDELRVGAEAEIDGGTASKAVTMVLPNL